MHDWIYIANELLIILGALTVLFSLLTWAAILFILLKECYEWGIRKIKGTKQASAKTEDGDCYSSYRDAVKRFSPRSRAMMSR
jgi:hypothetical protein